MTLDEFEPACWKRWPNGWTFAFTDGTYVTVTDREAKTAATWRRRMEQGGVEVIALTLARAKRRNIVEART